MISRPPVSSSTSPWWAGRVRSRPDWTILPVCSAQRERAHCGTGDRTADGIGYGNVGELVYLVRRKLFEVVELADVNPLLYEQIDMDRIEAAANCRRVLRPWR